MSPQVEWPLLLDRIEQDDLYRRVWLSTWFVRWLASQPDVLNQLWSGSSGGDRLGWRWCEYRVTGRRTYPTPFLLLYGNFLDRLHTAPVFVLRAPCRHCNGPGFFVSINCSKSDRELRGIPRGRCAACRKAAAKAASRRWRAKRKHGSSAQPGDPPR